MIQKTTLQRFTTVQLCFFSILLLFSISSFTTSVSSDFIEEETVPFDQTDEVPVFKGCDKAPSRRESVDCFNDKMMNHIKKNFRYPEEAADNDIQGKVEITFIINVDGLVKDIKTTSPDRKGILDKEAKRIIALLPKFQPGKHRGEIVNVKYNVPITFQIN